MLIKVTDKPINLNEAREFVAHPSCGAAVTFEGNIRSSNEGKEVRGLEYEIHESFLRAEVERIIEELKARWEIREIALIQRIGKLDVGETGIVIAASSAHRNAAFEACRYLIEEFKKRAPVWKKEYYLDRADWVFCHHASTPSDCQTATKPAP